jgi:hypothetical protein
MTTISALKHTEPAPPESTARRPRAPAPAGPPRPRSDHPKAKFYRRPSPNEADSNQPAVVNGGNDQPAAANSGSYL